MVLPLELWILLGVLFVVFILALAWSRARAVISPPGVTQKRSPTISERDTDGAWPAWLTGLEAASKPALGGPVIPDRAAGRASEIKAVGCGLSLLLAMLGCGIAAALYFILFSATR